MYPFRILPRAKQYSSALSCFDYQAVSGHIPMSARRLISRVYSSFSNSIDRADRASSNDDESTGLRDSVLPTTSNTPRRSAKLVARSWRFGRRFLRRGGVSLVACVCLSTLLVTVAIMAFHVPANVTSTTGIQVSQCSTHVA